MDRLGPLLRALAGRRTRPLLALTRLRRSLGCAVPRQLVLAQRFALFRERSLLLCFALLLVVAAFCVALLLLVAALPLCLTRELVLPLELLLLVPSLRRCFTCGLRLPLELRLLLVAFVALPFMRLRFDSLARAALLQLLLPLRRPVVLLMHVVRSQC